MAQDSINADELKRLEQEAAECAHNGDSLGALDTYEEMVRKGLAQARHMTALGHCYIDNRQRQNAKTIWMRAFDLDPNYEPCIEALDHYFSGWEKSSETTPPPRTFTRPRVTPPPPPPPSENDSTAGLSITVETTSTRQASPAPPQPAPAASVAPTPAPAPAPQRTAPAPKAAPAPAADQSLESTQAGMKAADATRVPIALDLADPRSIRWDFVMKDAADEATLRPRAHAHH